MKDESLIDKFMPDFDVTERHAIAVRATPERTFAAIRSADLTRSWVVRLLLTLRGMRRSRKIGLSDAFSIVDEDPPREIVLAIEGPFWNPACRPKPVRRDEPQQPGTARGAWNFIVAEGRLATETRVRCIDAPSRRKFRVYWFFIRPFSGLIRLLLLRAIRDEAERA